MLHVFREVLGGYTALPGEIRSLRSDLNEVWAIRPRIFPKEDQRKKPVGPRSRRICDGHGRWGAVCAIQQVTTAAFRAKV